MGHNYAQIGGKITPNFLQCKPNGPPPGGGGASAAGMNDTDETSRLDFKDSGDISPLKPPSHDNADAADDSGGCLDVQRAQDDVIDGWTGGREGVMPDDGTSVGGTHDDLFFGIA